MAQACCLSQRHIPRRLQNMIRAGRASEMNDMDIPLERTTYLVRAKAKTWVKTLSEHPNLCHPQK